MTLKGSAEEQTSRRTWELVVPGQCSLLLPHARWDTGGMNTATLLDIEAIRRACEQRGVQRLRVFGSVLSDRFDPEHSDIDFLVDFLPDRGDMFDDYFGLREALAEIVGREVDLVVARAVRNPYFKASAFASAQDVYAA